MANARCLFLENTGPYHDTAKVVDGDTPTDALALIRLENHGFQDVITDILLEQPGNGAQIV